MTNLNNKTEPDAPERNLEQRGLRTKAPKPNIIRIEVLDGSARERYLGGLQKFGDRNIKQALYQSFVPPTESVFYGFLKNQGEQTISLQAGWGKSGGTGGLLGDIKNIASQNEIASKVINAGENLEKIAKSVTGLDANLTGSSSLKRIDSIEVGGFSVTCGWYLPEQLKLAIASLRIITRMVYPRQVADSLLEQFVGDSVRSSVGSKKQVDDASTEASSGANVTPPTPTDPTQQNLERTNIAGTVLGGAAELGVGLYNSFNSLVGRNLTLDQFPVRVSIGHYIYIEPMVIDKLEINFSKEQWIAPNGRHLPIFCEVSIVVTSWLSPAPKLEFMQLLGNEMFGLSSHQQAVISEINASNKAKLDAEKNALQEKAQRTNSPTSIDTSTLNLNSKKFSSSNAAQVRAQFGGPF